MELHSEVRPIVQTMPGSEAFVLQTGGSARRRAIKPEGEAPTITFRVSGVPGHTHNSSAVASVLCDLKRLRGFTHRLTNAWSDDGPEMRAADIGDSDPVLDEDARFDRAIERGIGEITLIPENCHQQIREPTRSIAEVRALVTPQDKLRTMTYVEEVGGFVDPRDSSGKTRHISDYPDILVDMLGQQDTNNAEKDPVNGVQYTGVMFESAVVVESLTSSRSTNPDDGTGSGFDFVVLRDGNQSVGVLDDGSDWHGIVPFRWIQAEKLYRSAPFTVTLRRTVEVGPRPQAGANYVNEIPGPLTVTFPAMETTVASNGYCFLLTEDDIDATTVLLGATANNGLDYSPVPALSNVTKPGLHSVSTYRWSACPAYRFVVGGDAALPGPPVKDTQPFFEILRNMKSFNLAADMRQQFRALLDEGDNANWLGAGGNDNDLGDPRDKFNQFFANFFFPAREDAQLFPVAGLPRNAHKGATWYPLKDPWRPARICQQVLAYDGVGVDGTGQEVVREILASINVADAQNWRESDIKVEMNEASLEKVFDAKGMMPPGVLAMSEDAQEEWLENNLEDVNEADQLAEEEAAQDDINAQDFFYQAALDALAAQEAVVATNQTNYQNAVDAGAANIAALLQVLQLSQDILGLRQLAVTGELAELNVLKTVLANLILMRIPDFDKYYVVPHDYTGRVRFSISSAIDTVGAGNLLHAFDDADDISQKMMMIRQQLRFHREDEAQEFAFVNGTVNHTKPTRVSAYYHLLCDTEDTYGTEPVIRASGSIKELFELTQYTDVDEDGDVFALHVRSIRLPRSERRGFQYLSGVVAGGYNVPQDIAQILLNLLAGEEGDAHDPGASGYVDNDGNIVVQAVVDALLLVYQNQTDSTFAQFLTMGVGNALEVLMPDPVAHQQTGLRPVLAGYLDETGLGEAELLFQDLAFGFESPRVFFVSLNNIGTKQAHLDPDVYFFSTSDCRTEAREVETDGETHMHVCTRVLKTYRWNEHQLTTAHLAVALPGANGHMRDSCCLCQMGPEFQKLWFGEDGKTNVFADIQEESRRIGPVFLSKRRVSQHLCAPILNPNSRLQCSAPLNYDTRHLPPELRDFVLRLGNVDWSFLPGKVSMEALTLYEFNGGNQKPAAQENLLHLPQFREGSTTELTDAGEFDFEIFSPYGMPSYIAVFARDTNFKIDSETQPLVTQLSIMCNTTQKKSNTILKADVHQLYHITQRNVHPRAEYDRFDFNDRQVVLLRAEDIGLLGLNASEFQYEKRAVFRFQGAVDQVGRVTALLIFNNRGLRVTGKQLSVERLVRRQSLR